MDVRILGPIELSVDGEDVPLRGSRQRALLAALALQPGRTVSVRRLIDDLWGDEPPETAAKIVQIGVSGLRKGLPPDVLVTRPPGYALDVAREAVDVFRCERLLREGREQLAAGDAAAAASALGEALALWRGPALAGLDEPFAGPEAARLEELHLACLEERIAADLALGRAADLIGELEALVARNPLRERLREQQMLALYRSGRQAEALGAYQAARRVLDEELGLEPSASLRELERRMLQQDTSLDTPAQAVTWRSARAAPARDERPLVGRGPDRERLSRALASALAGSQAVVLLGGEAGAGKSTLGESLALEAAAAGALVGRGQCVEQHGTTEAYLPVLDALARAAGAPGGDALVAALAQRAPTWLAQLPWLASEDDLPGVQARVLGATRERMLREIVEALHVFAEARPLVLLLEDLQWSDASTVDLLAAIARRREPARLLVFGTFRTADAATREHVIHRVATELALTDLALRLDLPPLDVAEVGAYLAARLPGAELPADVAAGLAERTGGNPFFLEKVVDAWVDDGRVRSVPGGWQVAAGEDLLARAVPSSVLQLIRQRLHGIAPDDRPLLEAASVCGATSSAALVASAVGRLDDEVEEHLDALARDGVFIVSDGAETWPDGTVTTRYRFPHALLRELLYDDMPASRRVRLHRAAGERLGAAHGEAGTVMAAELANHFVRGHDPEAALPHVVAAAAHALSLLAPREASELVRTGLELLPSVTDETARAAHELTLRAMQGPSLIATEGWASPEAEAAFARAREIAGELGLADEAARQAFRLATVWETRGEYARSEGLLAELVHEDAPGPGADTLLDSYEILACSLFHQGRFAGALEAAEDGLARFDGRYASPFTAPYGEHPVVACHSWSAMAAWFLGEEADALERAERAIQLAREPARSHALAFALARAAIVRQARQEPAAALELASEAVEVATREGFSYGAAMSLILRGWSRAALGEAEDGAVDIELGLARSRATGASMDDAYYLGLLTDARLRAGALDAALASVGEALEISPRGGGAYFFDAELHRLRGEALRRSGESAAAELSLRRAVEVARSQGSPPLVRRAEDALSALTAAGSRSRRRDDA